MMIINGILGYCIYYNDMESRKKFKTFTIVWFVILIINMAMLIINSI